MRKHLLTFMLLAQSLVVFSQFTDNFSDGDFTNTPNWIDDIGNFVKIGEKNSAVYDMSLYIQNENSDTKIIDVTSEDELQLNTGMCLIWMEVFSKNGNVERFKKTSILNR